MTAQHFMQNPGEGPVDISEHVLLPGIGTDGFRLQTNAESGSVAGSEVIFDDPAGTFYPIGLNAYRVYETESDGDDPLLFSGGFSTRRELRGPYRTGGARQVAAQMEDGNAGLSRYVVRVGEGGNRPEETEEERMEWLFTTSGMALHWDILTSILNVGPTVMPAQDFTDFTPQQILDDMAQQTGKNYYVFWDGSGGNPPEALLVYGFDSGTHLTSDLRFSNVESDVDDETTFYLGLDTELSIDPSRIASYVSVRYKNGRVDEEDASTADEFSRIDKIMDGSYIKTAAEATARALKYLQELDDEEAIVSGTVYLPASKASQFRAGMRVEMKATHLTGLSTFTWVRLVNVTITQITTPDQDISYALAFEGNFTPPLSCEAVIEALVPQDSGDVNGKPVGTTIAAGDDDYLMFSMCAVQEVDIPISGGGSLAATTSGWTNLDALPPTGAHTESVVAYKANGSGAISFDWEPSQPAENGRIVSVAVPTTATAPGDAYFAGTSSGGSGISFGSPPPEGSLILLWRVAEGPTAFTGPPSGADWSQIAFIPDALENPDSDIELWACCSPADLDDLDTGQAGSSWWAHAVWVELT